MHPRPGRRGIALAAAQADHDERQVCDAPVHDDLPIGRMTLHALPDAPYKAA